MNKDIKIEWQQMPPQSGKEAGEMRLFPRLTNNGVTDLETLSRQVAKRLPFTRGMVEGVFLDLVDEIMSELAQGKTVDLNGLGTLRLAVGTEGDVTVSTKNRSEMVVVKGVHFAASSDLVSGIGHPVFTTVEGNDIGVCPSVEALAGPVQEYLAAHGSITRKVFQEQFGLGKSVALERLAAFQKMGILRSEGKNQKTVYVSAK